MGLLKAITRRVTNRQQQAGGNMMVATGDSGNQPQKETMTTAATNIGERTGTTSETGEASITTRSRSPKPNRSAANKDDKRRRPTSSPLSSPVSLDTTSSSSKEVSSPTAVATATTHAESNQLIHLRLRGLPADCKGCSVCFDLFEVGQTATYMPCGHFCHSACLMGWLQKCKTCPTCQASVPVEGERKSSDAASARGPPARSQSCNSGPKQNGGFSKKTIVRSTNTRLRVPRPPRIRPNRAANKTTIIDIYIKNHSSSHQNNDDDDDDSSIISSVSFHV